MNLRFRILSAAAALALAGPVTAETGVSVRAASYDNAIIGVMKQSAPLASRIAHFTAIVSDYYDMGAIAALVAGPAWAGASASDRQALVVALTRHSAILLAKNFDRYSGEQFVLDPAVQTRGDSTIIKATIQSSGGKKDVLYYRMRGGKIIDVTSGGVSQLAVQRSDVASTAASGGVAAVVKRLREIDAKYN
jgi:phospholipid transport system substrate-binding protein